MDMHFGDLMTARVIHMDGSETRLALEYAVQDDMVTASFPELADWSDVKAVDFAPELGKNSAGTDGYYVIPHGEGYLGDPIMCRFRDREDAEITVEKFVMPMWGCVQPSGSFAAFVASMTYEYKLIAAVKNGVYTCFARFELDGEAPYEPITIEFKLLKENADYNDIAFAYRKWRENRGEIKRYDARMQNRPTARYTAESIYVRIRQAWKPVPPLIREQTVENEPPMHVATTFEDVSELLDEFKAQGIDKAEFTLVGWNKSGHDGRWPQTFPVEEKLGGEEGLKKLTAKAKEMGYAMVGHTNSTDAYSIADCWNETELIRRKDGTITPNDQPWSGGDMYQVCPMSGLRQARELLPQVKEMGFSGTHYIDVITTVFPRACYDDKHPINRRQCAQMWNRILRLARQEFGSISSEGTFDFAASELDYGLYSSFDSIPCPLADERLPLWQLVYHGYVLSNPFTKTVNPTEEQLLKVLEYGGRPTFYYDAVFVTPDPNKDVNWMGDDDFHAHTPEDRKSSAEYISKIYHWYEGIRYLQLLTIKRHEILPDGKRRVTYENGDVVLVDYGAKKAYLNDKQILPMA